jgi:ABC-type dipeptide/oligopeptide/nickel transport system ATPase component
MNKVALNHFASTLVFAVALALGFSGCGGAQATQTHTPTVAIDSQFQSVVDEFTTEAQAQGTPVTITDLIVQAVPSMSGETMGDCTQDPSGAMSPTVQISQIIWDSLDTDAQQELMYHELGHCLLNRDHSSDTNNNLPVSIMSPVFFGSAIYDANKAQYLYELFHQNTNLQNAFPMIIPQNTFIPSMMTKSNS